jgi:hypothetical protein
LVGLHPHTFTDLAKNQAKNRKKEEAKKKTIQKKIGRLGVDHIRTLSCNTCNGLSREKVK